MKHHILFNIYLIVIFISVNAFVIAEDTDYKYISAELLVSDNEQAAKLFVSWAEKNGGYYLKHSDTGVILRILDFNNEEIETLLKNTGDIIHYSYNTENLQKEVSVLKAQLKSREKLLLEYYILLGNSDFRSTLSLEKEISNLLKETERLKGRIKKLEHDMEYALVDISFFSEDLYSDTELSSFEWINMVDFHLLMDEEIPDE